MHSSSGKIPIAIVCNSVPPYRLHVHRRIAREMQDVQLWTLQTHDQDTRWTAPAGDKEIGLVTFASAPSGSRAKRGIHLLRDWELGARLISFVRRAEVRAVIICGYNDMARIRLLLWCRWHGIPCLLSGDSNINDEARKVRGMKSVLKRVVLTGLLRFCAAVLPFGTAGKRYFEKYGVTSNRIFFFPLEPDYGAIVSTPPEIMAEVRQQFGLVEGRRRFLFCGRLVASNPSDACKRADLGLDAFITIAAQRPDWDMVFLGDGPLRPGLEGRVPAELRSRVIWTGHVGVQSRVSAVQRCCDVLVFPSDREAWGLVINEALAAGLAIVSSSIPGAAVDIVRDGLNGRIFPVGNLRALEQCMLDASSEPRLAAMRANSARVLDDWMKTADPIVGLRRALIAVNYGLARSSSCSS